MNKVVLCHNDGFSRAKYLENQTLPDNYMGDYTVMGFVVDRYENAVALLTSCGYQLEEVGECVEVIIDSSTELPLIKNILVDGEIHCEYSDIADTLYQA